MGVEHRRHIREALHNPILLYGTVDDEPERIQPIRLDSTTQVVVGSGAGGSSGHTRHIREALNNPVLGYGVVDDESELIQPIRIDSTGRVVVI